jgi:hypothetical protein
MNVQDYQHESWCDTQNNILNSCNCIVGYPLEVIENQEQEIDELKKQDQIIAKEIKTYKIIAENLRTVVEINQAENKKLREALEFYADRKNCDNPDFVHVEIDENGDEISDGGYRAREALKEIGELK